MLARIALAVVASFACAACPSPKHPRSIAAVTEEIGRPEWTVRALAGDARLRYTAWRTAAPGANAYAAAYRSQIEAVQGVVQAAPAWRRELAGDASSIVRAGTLLVAGVTGSGEVADVTLRGAPAVVVVGLDAATGEPRWRTAIDASEWVVIASVAAIGTAGDTLVGGSFSGTLRAADRVVSSGGKSDGFVARLTATGTIAWLIRAGGPGADAVHGVAVSPSGDRAAIAGTFNGTGADLLGAALVPFEDKSPHSDGFVAELDPGGGTRTWSASFGGKLDDSVAGVAIDGKGRTVVAASARAIVHVGGSDLVANGPSDGLVAWWRPDGTLGSATLVGGNGTDGLRAIIPAGDRVIVAGYFTGTVQLGARAHRADGDDAFLAAFDGDTIVASWTTTGEGREEIAALAPIPSGFAAIVAHTASASVDGVALPAPADPLSGAALIVRAL